MSRMVIKAMDEAVRKQQTKETVIHYIFRASRFYRIRFGAEGSVVVSATETPTPRICGKIDS